MATMHTPRPRKRKLALMIEDLIAPSANEKGAGSTLHSHSSQMSRPECNSPTCTTPARLSLTRSSPAPGAAGSYDLITEFGLAGVIFAVQLAEYIPPSFKHYRRTYYKQVLNATFRKKLDDEDASHLLLQADNLSKTLAVGSPDLKPLWTASASHAHPLVVFLGPPTTTCTRCSRSLETHNPPVKVIVYTMTGPLLGTKITLRCVHCCLSYRYSRYGSEAEGYQYYSHQRQFVEASQVCYVDRELHQMWIASRYVH